MKFVDLELHPDLLHALDKLGYQEATPIQEAVAVPALEGKDIAGLAQTGTGKTAAFLLPLMDRILRSRQNKEELSEKGLELYNKRAFKDWKPQNFVLVLVPTRELCEQVVVEMEKLKGNAHLKAAAIYGGTGYDKQLEGIRGGAEFIVGTPGRLIDLYKSHAIDLAQVRAVVFDEADRMFDMGFRDDMKYLLRRLPQDRQFLVLSATLNFEVLNTAYQFGAHPVEFNLSRDQAKAENVEDSIYHVGQDDKPAYLLSILKRENPTQVIVFSNFKHNVERINRFLNENSFPAVAISSLLTQAQRTRVMEQFKSAGSDKSILVATDVAARGLDIKGVDMVINYELPDDCETYVHRIGRTGRAGALGKAFSLVSDRDVEALSRIEEYVKHKLTVAWMEDADIVKDFAKFKFETEDRPRRDQERGGQGRGGPRRDNDRRESRGGGGGGRDRRPPRGGDRPQGPRQDRPPQHAQAASTTPHSRPTQRPAQGAAATSGGTHRDRLRGRHEKDHRETSNGPTKPHRGPAPKRDGKHPHKPHRSAQRSHGKSSHSSRPHAKRPPTKGITATVSSFFKKLFGA